MCVCLCAENILPVIVIVVYLEQDCVAPVFALHKRSEAHTNRIRVYVIHITYTLRQSIRTCIKCEGLGSIWSRSLFSLCICSNNRTPSIDTHTQASNIQHSGSSGEDLKKRAAAAVAAESKYKMIEEIECYKHTQTHTHTGTHMRSERPAKGRMGRH